MNIHSDFPDDELIEDLVGGWSKRCVRRKTEGAKTEGRWDVYVTAPDGKRLRSTIEILRHIEKTHFRPNPAEVNMEISSRISGREININSPQAARLAEGLEMMDANGGILPDDFGAKKGRAPGSGKKYDDDDMEEPRERTPKMRHEKIKMRMPGGGKSGPERFPFKEKQLKYLKRQFEKVPYPTVPQVAFLAKQLKTEVDDITRWLNYQRKKLEAEFNPKKESGGNLEGGVENMEVTPDVARYDDEDGARNRQDSSEDDGSDGEKVMKKKLGPKSMMGPKSKIGPKSKMGPKSKIRRDSEGDEAAPDTEYVQPTTLDTHEEAGAGEEGDEWGTVFDDNLAFE